MNLRCASAVLLCGLIAGCGAARPSKYYQLTVPTENAADPPAQNVYPVRILVGPLAASHLYREENIVYSSNGESMGVYQYQRWVMPPTELIQNVIFRSLRASGRYRAVHSMRSSMHGDYLLQGRLYDFKEINGGSIVGRLAMEMELRDNNSGETVWTHLYHHDEPVAGKDINAIVAALNRNVQRATAEIASSLEQYFAAHPPSAAAQ